MRRQMKQAMRGGKMRAVAALLALLTASCESSKVWVNPDVPQDEWASDRMICKEQAQVQAEREFTLDQQTSRNMNYDLGGQWSGQMNRFSAQQRQGRLFASCMTSRGYALVPADQAPQGTEPAGADPASSPGADVKAAPPQ